MPYDPNRTTGPLFADEGYIDIWGYRELTKQRPELPGDTGPNCTTAGGPLVYFLTPGGVPIDGDGWPVDPDTGERTGAPNVGPLV
jgi:hypothetical protein